MKIDLRWFAVRLALISSPERAIHVVVQSLQNELNRRPHLRNPNVKWDPDLGRAIVELEKEEFDAEFAAEGAAEELLEVASAVITDFDECRVEILGVQTIDD